MLTDIEIANGIQPKTIDKICGSAKIDLNDIEQYGKYKAKINNFKFNPKAKIILVTAINPTSLGEGKTTMSIGIADGLKKLGKNVMLALREPSLGPVFGVKGGATGGGYSQVVPMADINLHFTGDLHAVTSANNLLSAAIDNHIFQGNPLKINPSKVIFKRCLDMNDRALRHIVCGLGGEADGVTRQDGFTITAASEVMAILCLSSSLEDLKTRLSNILVAYNFDNEPVFCKDLDVQDAMAILLKDAIKPNLVQTLEGTPALIHGGPFANIAHGCNSIIATKLAATYADYVVTEAGFGADLGAEKFLDVKCRIANIKPSAVVIVATVKAIKLNGGADVNNLQAESIDYVEKGIINLGKHIENIQNVFKLPCLVAINKFHTDTDKEIEFIQNYCKQYSVKAIKVTSFSDGSDGSVEMAKEVLKAADSFSGKAQFCYNLEDSIENKINSIVQKIYGGNGAKFSERAKKQLKACERLAKNLPVIIAKTQYSLSDNPKLLGRPKDFYVNINEIKLSLGAGFAVAVAGDINLMPGLGKSPAAQNMNITPDGIISGLF